MIRRASGWLSQKVMIQSAAECHRHGRLETLVVLIQHHQGCQEFHGSALSQNWHGGVDLRQIHETTYAPRGGVVLPAGGIGSGLIQNFKQGLQDSGAQQFHGIVRRFGQKSQACHTLLTRVLIQVCVVRCHLDQDGYNVVAFVDHGNLIFHFSGQTPENRTCLAPGLARIGTNHDQNGFDETRVNEHADFVVVTNCQIGQDRAGSNSSFLCRAIQSGNHGRRGCFRRRWLGRRCGFSIAR
mmetsp:Transcript_3442/g.7183  ORF Transcript_3442/g.7183 Transcript_3442/m.7183 type:complete len:240 (-) Transcript_3442:265-984(-)